jgi:hypothetical protein
MDLKEKILLLIKLIENEENDGIYFIQSKNENKPDIDELKSEILNKFGLPPTSSNLSVFNLLFCWRDDAVDLILEELYRKADEYHSLPVKSKQQLLDEFKEGQLDHVDLFAELGYANHIYNLYLAVVLFKQNLIHSDKFIGCLVRSDNTELLRKLGRVISLDCPLQIMQLQSDLKSIAFIKEYVNYFKDEYQREPSAIDAAGNM